MVRLVQNGDTVKTVDCNQTDIYNHRSSQFEEIDVDLVDWGRVDPRRKPTILHVDTEPPR